MLASQEKRFATTRQYACPYLSSLFWFPAVGSLYQRWVSRCRETAPQRLGFSIWTDTQVRIRSCILDSNFIQMSEFLHAKIVVDVFRGCSRRNEYESACSLDRRRDLRRLGTMPVLTYPCCSGSLLWVAYIKDEAIAAGNLRPSYWVRTRSCILNLMEVLLQFLFFLLL